MWWGNGSWPSWPAKECRNSWLIHTLVSNNKQVLAHAKKQRINFVYFRNFWDLRLVFQVYWSCMPRIGLGKGPAGLLVWFLYIHFSPLFLSRDGPSFYIPSDAEERWKWISPRTQSFCPGEKSRLEERSSRHKPGKAKPSIPKIEELTPALEPKTRISDYYLQGENQKKHEWWLSNT